MIKFFTKLASIIADFIGSPYAFIGALLSIVIWAASGPIFGFSETWQLVINTGTTIVTFLIVFLIQNSQNRDNLALQLKLDILILSLRDADNAILDAEDLDYEELKKIKDALIRRRGKKNSGVRTKAERSRS